MGFRLLERFKANDEYLKEEEKMTVSSNFNDVGFGATNGSEQGLGGEEKGLEVSLHFCLCDTICFSLLNGRYGDVDPVIYDACNDVLAYSARSDLSRCRYKTTPLA